ncbi:MAG TPA: site-2 protease family protein [Candidatus Dormibacteraeota bacterium]|nr:site-2 protease family protein [Candidatus Dormibacteraeota bacterium]
MRSEGIQIGRIYGIPIFLHASWFLIFALITYSFITEFGALNLNLPVTQLWGIGILTSLLFFGSLVFHEMAHSVVARHYKIPVISITLFVFGGIARIARDPSRAVEEFNIAVAGPLSSLLLAGAFWLVYLGSGTNALLKALAYSLSTINLALAIFNLVPGFPLDGGRIFRAIVWGITKDFSRSTRIAARTGQVIAYGMIGLGAAMAVTSYIGHGDVISGMWLAFIGWFLLTAARQSRAQADARGALEGLRVSDIMTADLPTIGRAISLEDYAREILRTGRRAHLVVAHEQLVGLMTTEALHAVPQQDWDVTSVQAVMLPKDKLHWAAPEEPALSLLDRMRTVGMQQMPVIAGGSVVGIVTRDSILRVLQARHELGTFARQQP